VGGVAEEGKAMSEPPLQSEHTAPRGALAVVVEELPGLLEELGEEATGGEGGGTAVEADSEADLGQPRD